jgi:5-methylcytosine-specific restriction enzyme A
MAEAAELLPGEEINNERLCELFGCGPQGGMRRAHKTGTLVIVSNHVETIYDDRWLDGVLHYTGMGQRGDQSLSGTQNKTLAESGANGVAVHLFEVHRPHIYTYNGEVVLAGEPYQENQVDADGNDRKVWVFPLTPKSGAIPPVRANVVQELTARKEWQARRLSDEEIAARAARSGREKVGTQAAIIKQHQRSVWVAEHAKRRAAGRCELCQKPAPFQDRSGNPYLETHHIIWLARGGADTIENTVALCPNCHRQAHVLEVSEDIDRMTQSVSEGN